jgi:hypothetical protein
MNLLIKLHHHMKEIDSYMGKDILMYCAARPPILSLIVALCFPTLPAQDFLTILSTFLKESFNSDESHISTHSQTSIDRPYHYQNEHLWGPTGPNKL